jgi:hypothetical protein
MPITGQTMFDEDTFQRRQDASNDDTLLRLSCEWIDCKHAAERVSGAEFAAICNRIDAIETATAELPAAGPAGLVIKAYLTLHVHWGQTSRDEDPAMLCGVSPADAGEIPSRLLQGFMRDVVRFVPELALLVADIIAAPPDAAQRAHLAQRAKALAETGKAPLPAGDAGLVEAERRLAVLRPGLAALYREFAITAELEEEVIEPTVGAAIEGLDDFIDEAAPQTLCGAAVKLRRLADAQQQPCAAFPRSAALVLAAVERAIADRG